MADHPIPEQLRAAVEAVLPTVMPTRGEQSLAVTVLDLVAAGDYRSAEQLIRRYRDPIALGLALAHVAVELTSEPERV